MRGMLGFQEQCGTEEGCIEALARLRWPQGYVCARCGERRSWQLKAWPRTFECARCGHQESVTAGTIFHRTRTPLYKWFVAGWWMARDKRGVSALFLSREFGLRYETAWLIAHKLRHALNERPEFPLEDFIEVDERIADLADFVLRRAMARPTITYTELVNGLQPHGTLPALTG